jgi:hypothetical protein
VQLLHHAARHYGDARLLRRDVDEDVLGHGSPRLATSGRGRKLNPDAQPNRDWNLRSRLAVSYSGRPITPV